MEGNPIVLVCAQVETEFVDKKYFSWTEFHQVDLTKEELKLNCYPKLLTWDGRGDIFHAKADQKIYIIGGLTESSSPYDNDNQCGYDLDINNTDDGWNQFMLPVKSTPRCVMLDGKFYVFDFPDLVPTHPGPLEMEIIYFSPEHVSSTEQIVADPCNKQILLCEKANLYAYYPHNREFKLLGKNVYSWSETVTIVENVAYVFLDRYLFAYDLSDMAKPLKVVWAPSVGNFKFTFEEYDTMFHGGSNNFWFAVWTPDYKKKNTRLYFVKFKAERAGNKITCTPLDLKMFVLDSACSNVDFYLLDAVLT